MSERQELAERLAKIVRDWDMVRPFGGDVSKANNHYDFAFSYPAVLDGFVQVWGENFIRIECQGKWAPSYSFSEVFESEKNAASFLTAIARADTQAALEVPVRARK